MKLFTFPVLLSLMLSLNVTSPALSQSILEDIPPEEYFDFWIGEWNLMWADPDSSAGTGFNRIERILDGAVIKENFEGLTGVK